MPRKASKGACRVQSKNLKDSELGKSYLSLFFIMVELYHNKSTISTSLSYSLSIVFVSSIRVLVLLSTSRIGRFPSFSNLTVLVSLFPNITK